MSQAYTLASAVAAAADQPSVFVLQGGRFAAIFSGTLATTNVIQVKARDGSWVTVQTVTAAGLQAVLYLPAGEYRLHLTGGSPASLNADLYSV